MNDFHEAVLVVSLALVIIVQAILIVGELRAHAEPGDSRPRVGRTSSLFWATLPGLLLITIITYSWTHSL